MSALNFVSKMNREDITISGCLMGAAALAKCFGYNWAAAGFATTGAALFGTSFFMKKNQILSADVANLLNEITSAQQNGNFEPNKDSFVARYLQLQKTARFSEGSTEHTYLVAVFRALNNSSQPSTVSTQPAGAAVDRTQNAAQVVTGPVVAAPARAALPQVETRGYYHQFNIHQNEYPPATWPLFQKVPDANQGCSSMGLCMLNHLREGLPVDAYNLDSVLAKGARMDAQVRRKLRMQTTEGMYLHRVFPNASPGSLPAIQKVGSRHDGELALDPDQRTYITNIQTALKTFIERNPTNNGPLGAILLKNGHFISLYIDREAGVLKGIYLIDTRNAFDNGVVPSEGPQGVVFQPLGNDVALAAQKMAELLPTGTRGIVPITEVVFKP